LDLPTIPAVFGVTQTWIRRALAIAAAVLLVLAGAIVAFQVLRPSNAPMATRVADSLKGGLKSTSDFAACAPAAAGSPRYLCDVQFKGSTCPPQGTLLRTSLLLPMKTPRASMISELAFADSSDTRLNSTPTARTTPAPSAVPAPSETPTVEPGACVLQFIAEVSQSRQEVMFQRASKDASRSTASMNGSSEVPLKSE
jgi:hypothetical protein